MSTVERRITSNSWVASSSGRTVQTHAAAPDTIGAAKLVPSPVRQPFSSALAIGISTPGAARSTKRDRLENSAIPFARSLAADGQHVRDARRIPERVAGVAVVAGGGDDQRALPHRLVDRLLDHRSLSSAPRLRLTTPGPLFAAARIPCTIWNVSSCVPWPLAASHERRIASG